MSTMKFKRTICGCCGTEHVELVLSSTNQMELGDLDLRPGEMYRSTMGLWIQKCKNCGYVADDLSDGKIEYRSYLNTDEYLAFRHLKLFNELTTRFYRYGLLNLHLNMFTRAYHGFLHAAWAADDSGNNDAAVVCRTKAIELFDRIIESGEMREDIILIQADMLRRTERFLEVKELLEHFHFHKELYQDIADYQLMLSDNKETAAYKQSQAIAYAKKKNSDWIEQMVPNIKERDIKMEILNKFYPQISLKEKRVFDAAWQLVDKLKEYMKAFYEKYRTSKNLLKYLEIINNTNDYSFLYVQNEWLKPWFEGVFAKFNKEDVIRYAVKIVEYMNEAENVSEQSDETMNEETKAFLRAIEEAVTGKGLNLTDEEQNMKKILTAYERAFDLLDQYDHQSIERFVAGHSSNYSVTYDECRNAIDYMRKNSFSTSDLFGKEKDDSFKGSIANIEQTYNGEAVYNSLEEKAANLLYFTTKNHSFYDGNKRIAAAMFLYYLNKNDRLFLLERKKIDDATIAALTIMIAESRPEDKEMMISIIINCIYM